MNTEDNCLFFKDVKFYILYTFILSAVTDFSQFKEAKPSWDISDLNISDERVKRLFHPRYLSTISSCKIITPPSIKIKGIDIESFRSISWPNERDHKNIYRKLVEEKSEILENTTLQIEIWVFPGGFCGFLLCFNLHGNYSSRHLVALANGLIDYGAKLRLISGRSSRIVDIICDVSSKLIYHTHSSQEDFSYYESFSIIVPEQIEPGLPEAKDYFKPPYNRSLFSVSIRRGEFQEVDVDVFEKTQKNISVYKSDILILNYHNMLIYVRGELHIPPFAYINIIVMLKTMAAMLHHYDIMTYRQLRNIKNIPNRLKDLRSYTRQLEKTKLQVIQAIDTFRMLTGVSSVRAKMIIDSGLQIFEIEPLVQSLDHKLQDMNSLLSSHYNLQMQKQLQLLTIIFSFFTLIVTITGIIGLDRLIEFFKKLFGG